MSIVGSLDGEPCVTFGTFVRLLFSVGVFMVTKKRLLFERLTTEGADEFLALEHPILVHLHRLARFEPPIAYFTFELIFAVVSLTFLEMNFICVSPKLLVGVKLLLASTTNVRFLSQLFHALNNHLFLVIHFEMSLQYILIGKLLVAFRTWVQPFHIHLPLMTQEFLFRVEPSEAVRTFEWILLDFPFVCHPVPVVILV